METNSLFVIVNPVYGPAGWTEKGHMYVLPGEEPHTYGDLLKTLAERDAIARAADNSEICVYQLSPISPETIATLAARRSTCPQCDMPVWTEESGAVTPCGQIVHVDICLDTHHDHCLKPECNSHFDEDGHVLVCASCDHELEPDAANGHCIVCEAPLCGACHTACARCWDCEAAGDKFILVSTKFDDLESALPFAASIVNTVGRWRIVRVAAPLVDRTVASLGEACAELHTQETDCPVVTDDQQAAESVAAIASA